MRARPLVATHSPPDPRKAVSTTPRTESGRGLSSPAAATAATLREEAARLAGQLDALNQLRRQGPYTVLLLEDVARRLGVDEVPTLHQAMEVELAGRSVTKGDPLFPRADLKAG